MWVREAFTTIWNKIRVKINIACYYAIHLESIHFFFTMIFHIPGRVSLSFLYVEPLLGNEGAEWDSPWDNPGPWPCPDVVIKNMETLAPPTGHGKYLAVCDLSMCQNVFLKADRREWLCSFIGGWECPTLPKVLKIHRECKFRFSLSDLGSSYGSSWSLRLSLQSSTWVTSF